MIRQGIIELVQPGGITIASSVEWQNDKSGEQRLCVDFKVHIIGKFMDEDLPISGGDNLSQLTLGPML